MTQPSFAPRALALAAATLAFVGCGGGGGSEAPAQTPVPTPAVGDTMVLTSTGRLLSFNRATPATVISTVMTTPTATNVVGGDVRPNGNQLYLLSRSATGAGTLSVVNATTGAVTGSMALAADPADTTSPYGMLTGTRFGVDFNPVADRLRVVSDTGQNLRINVANGLVTTDADINGQTGAMLVEAAYTNNLTDACATQLFVLNATDGNLYVQDPPNDGTVGSARATSPSLAPVAPTDAIRFDIRTTPSTRADEAVVTKNSTVYGLNLTTGATTQRGTIGTLGTTETIVALFVTGAPGNAAESGTAAAQQGTLLTVLGTNVVTFNATTPQKLCSSAAISGLASGETILGTDFRPAKSTIVGLTSGAKLFTLNPYTGAATASTTPLLPDPTDTSDPYSPVTGLPATESYGVDFDPAADRLRLVSSTGRNYSINADNGQVTTDTALAPPTGSTAVVTAAAYTNSAPLANGTMSFAAPTASDLYDIDSGAATATTNTLYKETAPAAGTLTSVGALGVAGGQMNGFDIVSARTSTTDPNAQTNTAYAALTVMNVSNLYTVNLSTGAATLVGPIGDGTATVRGLTRAK